MPDLRDEQTEIRICAGCGREISTPLPKGLLGEFRHIRCDDPANSEDMYGVLNASYFG